MKTPDSTQPSGGRTFSPVIRADSKFFGEPPNLCVDVCFTSPAQIDALIAALTKLRELPDGGFDHVHIQDTAFVHPGSSPVLAEIIFWHPSLQRDEVGNTCVSDAARALASLPIDRR